MLTIHHRVADAFAAKLDVLYVIAVEGEELSDHCKEIAQQVESAVKAGDFTGKAKQLLLFYADKGHSIQRLGIVGAGKRNKLDMESVRNVGAKILENARELKVKSIGVHFEHFNLACGEAETAAALAEGFELGDYKFIRHKTEADKGQRRKPEPKDKSLEVNLFGKDKKAAAAVAEAVTVCQAANETRTMSDEPGNIATPTFLADEAVRLGKAYGFSVEVMDEDAMRSHGMGSLLSVAAGSVEPARLIIMEHKPKKVAGKLETICIVGKGLTFDAGGISIKPADRMWEMKYDKCGGTAVLGAMCAISALKMPFHVYGLVPASENLPDGAATKPGDIVTAMTGHTIEVLNTDAEGRLILADALGYAHRYKPDVVIDLATLTGACVVALASVRAGVMGDEKLCDDLKAAGESTGEKVWPLPLDDEYGEMLKSDHADLKNIGGRWGGALTAGYFLKHFVPPKAQWAHIDIAGPAWKTDNTGGRDYIRRGATGFGVRLLVEFLRRRAAA